MPIPQFTALGAVQKRVPEVDKTTKGLHDLSNEAVHLAEQVYNLLTKPDENLSHLAISKVIIEKRDKLADFVFLARKKAHEIAEEQKQKLISAGADKVGLKQDEYAAETRAIFRSYPVPQQIAFLNQALEKQNGSALAAILMAPAMLSGLPEDRHEHYRDTYLGKLGGKGRLDHIDDTLAVVLQIFDIALTV